MEHIIIKLIKQNVNNDCCVIAKFKKKNHLKKNSLIN